MGRKSAGIFLMLVVLFVFSPLFAGGSAQAVAAPEPPPLGREAGYAGVHETLGVAVMPGTVALPLPAPVGARCALWLFPAFLLQRLLRRRSRLLFESRLRPDRVAAQRYVGHPHHAPPAAPTKPFFSRVPPDVRKFEARGCLLCFG